MVCNVTLAKETVTLRADVAELADALDLGSSGCNARGSSNLPIRTNKLAFSTGAIPCPGVGLVARFPLMLLFR